MMGLPRAYRLLGSVLGTGLIIVVGLLTYWSMAVMVKGGSACFVLEIGRGDEGGGRRETLPG
jgi:hypothetical protein